MISKIRALATCAVTVGLAGTGAALAAQPGRSALPIIPGGHQRFGMQTPAGSGRHLRDVSLPADWDTGLVGRWDFDEGIPDGGELVGDAAIVERGKGKALQLKGDGALKLPRAEGYLKPGGSFTVMAWVKLDKPGGFVVSNDVKGKGYWRLGHTPGFGGKWMFWLANPAGETMHSEYRRDSIGQWRHVAAVYDGATGQCRFYTHGRLGHDAWNKTIQNLVTARSANLTIGRGVTGMIDDVMVFDVALDAQQVAALHASRYAAYHGDRRTRVLKVTNLNTEGPGSLRAALAVEGPRVIVFEVAGTIDFSPFEHLSITQPHVTVAGQTAPSPGITLKACELSIRTHDVLLQHLRIRTGDLLDPTRPLKNKAGWTQFSERDCMKVEGQRIVIDHCSFSWSTDELAQSGAGDATFRQNIFAEALHSPKHHKGGHSRALLVGTYKPEGSQNVAIIGNLFAHNKTRNPSILRFGQVVIANNLIYDANVGIKGGEPGQKDKDLPPLLIAAQGNAMRRVNSPFVARGVHPACRLYFGTDNMVAGQTFASRDAVWERVSMPFKPGVREVCRAKEPPLAVPGLKIKPAKDVEAWVLAHAGARPADRDPVDARVVKNVREGTGKIIASQEDVGGWPELQRKHRKLALPKRSNADDDGDGYTNLEEWLHTFAADVEGNDS